MDFDSNGMAERVIQWSNINSGSYNVLGLERMSAVLTQAFSELDCEGDLLSLPPIEQIDELGQKKTIDLGPLLRFWKRPKASKQILLMGHMDTVFSINHPFQKAYYKDDQHKILVGPGVADMKGGLCVILEALRAFEKNPQNSALGWELLINPDEEIGSLGSAPYLEEHAKKYDLALLFEPAMDEKGTLAGDRKGSGKFTLIVYGTEAHAGRNFNLGRNAINALADMILHLEKLNDKREGLTLNIGRIEGGGAENVVPGFAIAKLDVRILTMEDASFVQKEIETAMAEISKRREVKIELHGQFTRKPKKIDAKMLKLYELVAALAKEEGQALNWKLSGGCSDGNNLAALGVANVDTLGVCGGKIHSEEEFLLVESLGQRARLNYAILSHLARNNL